MKILICRRARRWGDADKFKFLSVSRNTGPLQAATSTVSATSGVFCISAVQKYLLARVTAAHTAALCWLPLYWPAAKGKYCWDVDLLQLDFFPLLHIFLFHMYVPCKGSIKVGFYLNTAAPCASKTAVSLLLISDPCSMPSFQNLSCLKISFLAQWCWEWTENEAKVINSSWKIIHCTNWAV